MKHSLLMLTALAMVVSCKPTVPSKYIQPDDLEDILYDYHLAEAMAKNGLGNDADLRRNAYFQAVLSKHDITEADFDSSLVYYYSHLDRLKDVYGRVNGRIAEEAERVGASVGDISLYSQYNASGDTANIWTGPQDVMLIPRPARNRYDFTVKADTTFLQGDSFMFQFQTEYICQNGTPSAYICISARYANDSIRQYSSRAISSTGISQLRIPGNRDAALRDLRGFIYLGNDKFTELRQLMFVSQIQLIRFHDKTIPADAPSDTLKTDSLQRVDNPERAVADTTRRPAPAGLRSKHAPFRKGGGGH